MSIAYMKGNLLKFLFQSEFEKHQYLTEERRLTLSNELNLSVSQIKVWFQVGDFCDNSRNPKLES